MLLYVVGLIIGSVLLYNVPTDEVEYKADPIDIKDMTSSAPSEERPYMEDMSHTKEIILAEDSTFSLREEREEREEDTSIRSISEPGERRTSKRSKGEQATLEAIERITGKKFVTVRPNFLKNPETKRNLEIDLYNHDLRLAVEYNGIQHYKFPNFAAKTENDFIQQIRRDDFKRRSCDKHGVFLISVPYTISNDKIEAYLRSNIPLHMTLLSPLS